MSNKDSNNKFDFFVEHYSIPLLSVLILFITLCVMLSSCAPSPVLSPRAAVSGSGVVSAASILDKFGE